MSFKYKPKNIIILAKLSIAVCSMLTLGNTYAEELNLLNQQEIKQVVTVIGQQMKAEYISAEQGEEMSSLLESKFLSGEYNHFNDPLAFSEQLTSDLRSVNQDEHIRVDFAPERVSAQQGVVSSDENLKVTEQELRVMQRKNFGFKTVDILPGNIGYINLTDFHDPTFAAETAVAAMNYVANTDALIFDLRENGGGRESMFQLIASYLYDAEPVLLNNAYKRSEDKFYQTWSLPYVQGKRRPDIDVYILTSDYTFSAAEAFSYSLKHLKRATLVGEVTGGGAHGGSPKVVSDRFTLWLPRFEIINPITNTDWEGTGVLPNITTTKTEALNVAYTTALEKLMVKFPEEAHIHQWHLASHEAKKQTIQLSSEILANYSGLYSQHRELKHIDGKLYYQSSGNKRLLTPLSETLFQVDGVNYFRIQIQQESGKVKAILGLYENGRTISYQRKS